MENWTFKNFVGATNIVFGAVWFLFFQDSAPVRYLQHKINKLTSLRNLPRDGRQQFTHASKLP